MPSDPYFFYILAAFAVSVVALSATGLHAWLRLRSVRKQLEVWEKRDQTQKEEASSAKSKT